MNVWVAVWDTDNGITVEVFDSEAKAEKAVINDLIEAWIDPVLASKFTHPDTRAVYEHVKHVLEDGRWRGEFESIGDLLNHLDEDDFVRIEEAEVA